MDPSHHCQPWIHGWSSDPTIIGLPPWEAYLFTSQQEFDKPPVLLVHQF